MDNQWEAEAIFKDLVYVKNTTPYSREIRSHVQRLIRKNPKTFISVLGKVRAQHVLDDAAKIIEAVVKDRPLSWGVVITLYTFGYVTGMKYRENKEVISGLKMLIVATCLPFLQQEGGWKTFWRMCEHTDPSTTVATSNMVSAITVSCATTFNLVLLGYFLVLLLSLFYQ